jgi:putative ATPase
MRGSDPDAALHWLARMLVAGEDPRFIARRIVIFASEDVGMADPQALAVATAAAQAVQLIGLPEAQLNLAHAVVHCATAPKSNAVTTAIGAALADVRAGRGGEVPRALRDAHYPGSKGLGHGKGYRYPHDDVLGVVTQQYAPDDLVGVDYYRPTGHGAERAVADRLPRLRRIVRGLTDRAAPDRPGPDRADPPGTAAGRPDGEPGDPAPGAAPGTPGAAGGAAGVSTADPAGRAGDAAEPAPAEPAPVERVERDDVAGGPDGAADPADDPVAVGGKVRDRRMSAGAGKAAGGRAKSAGGDAVPGGRATATVTARTDKDGGAAAWKDEL